MAVGISADGGEIAWGTANPCPERTACPETMGVLEHRLLLPTKDRFFEQPEAMSGDASAYNRAALATGHWSLSAVPGGADMLDNGALEIALGGAVTQTIVRDATNGYLHSAFTLIDNGLRLISGGNDGTLIEYFSATGTSGRRIPRRPHRRDPRDGRRREGQSAGDRQCRPDAAAVEPQDARTDRLDGLCRHGMGRLDAAGLLLLLRRRRHADRLARQPGPRQGRPLRARRASSRSISGARRWCAAPSSCAARRRRSPRCAPASTRS